jgi:hypothetical protein
MELETIKKVEQSIENLENRKSRIYFLVQDTKGHAKGAVRYTYQMALTLKENGFNPIIIHEKNDYVGVSEWLGEEYMTIKHESIESQGLKITPDDFIIIPEIYGHVLEQVSNLPCAKIVMCQAYDHMLETIQPGATWTSFGFYKCITTSEEQMKYIKSVMKNVTFDIIPPVIPKYFSKKPKPSKPIISIHTREPRDTMKIIKTFYLKYPQYRWITFRDMRGLTQEQFSEYLKDSFVSIWVDDTSGFGTFPIESMASRTPVIAKVPNLKPAWMNDNNGIWTYDYNQIIDIVAEFTQNWLEDNISEELYTAGLETASKYTNHDEFTITVLNTFNEYFETRKETFKVQLDKLKTNE